MSAMIGIDIWMCYCYQHDKHKTLRNNQNENDKLQTNANLSRKDRVTEKRIKARRNFVQNAEIN